MRTRTVCVVGLGYVGLPLAEAFSKHLKTIGFDIDEVKINFFVSQKPLLKMLTQSAAGVVGKNLKKGAIVVLESTVYPGVTEEVVKLILERESGLKYGVDFKIGYSPERINPGDEVHSLEKIMKIVAGMDDETTENLAELYGLITWHCFSCLYQHLFFNLKRIII